MPGLPPFQTLPIHIAEAIARYCIGLQRHRDGHSFNMHTNTEITWLVLHDVSYSWKQLARRNINKSVNLFLSSNPDNDELTTSIHLLRVIEQSTAIIPHVKKVDIHFDDIVEEPNGEDLEKLGRVWPEDLVFPKARSLTCVLAFKNTKASNNARNDKYFKWFVERVQSSLPNLQEITIEFGECGEISVVSPGVLFSNERNVSLFISALFRTAMWGVDDILNPAYIDNEHILIQNAPELTSFSFPGCLNFEFAGWITKKSAKTLEKLYYSEVGSGGFRDFLFDDDGQVIVYPRLRDLYVADSSNSEGELTTDKSIVPFPALQRLEMHSSCVFKDDTLFRGFGKTLTSLNIGLHRGFVDIFRKYKVFLQGAYPGILHIDAALDNRSSLTLPAGEFAEATFGLVSPATQSITISCYILYQRIISVIPTCPHLVNIQILHFTGAILSLLEVLNILKHFPNVTDFGCRFRGIDSELDTIQGKLIPNHLGTQYSQFTSRLKCWHTYTSDDASDEEVAVLLVTLAVLCPNFTYVKEVEWNRDANDNKIGYILGSGLYDQHAKRLEHLFES